MKPKLYTFPDWNEAQTVFEFDDLQDDAFLVLCVRALIGVPGHEHDQHKVFVWKGSDFNEDEARDNEVITPEDFVQRVMEQYWGCRNPQDQFNILLQNEMSGAESDEFSDYFG